MNSEITFSTYSLGCRTNQAEIEEISEKLIKLGWIYNIKNPFVVILNTCVVTSKAELETRKEIRQLKKKYPKAKIVVLGCAVSGQKLGIQLPKADLLIDNKAKKQTPILIKKNFFTEKIVCSPSNLAQPNLSRTIKSKYTQSGRKFIKIQDGCNRFCSYCITCFLRGKPESKPVEVILKEINTQIVLGIKEIILTGINLSLYKDKKIDCAQLAKIILDSTKIERLSFSSIHPELIKDEFIKIIVNNPRINQCLHLSLQSGSPTVLKRMNRTTDLTQLSNQIKKIKRLNRNFVFRADIIVGFPNESKDEFEETLKFVKKSEISFAHIFRYSPRVGTLADKKVREKEWQLIDKSTMKNRISELKKIIEQNKFRLFASLNNKTVRCLITQPHKGIIENGIEIDLDSEADAVGQIAKVGIKIIDNQIVGIILEILKQV